MVNSLLTFTNSQIIFNKTHQRKFDKMWSLSFLTTIINASLIRRKGKKKKKEKKAASFPRKISKLKIKLLVQIFHGNIRQLSQKSIVALTWVWLQPFSAERDPFSCTEQKSSREESTNPENLCKVKPKNTKSMKTQTTQ